MPNERALSNKTTASVHSAPTVLFPGTTEIFFDKDVWNVRLSGGGLSAPMRFQPGKDSSNAKNLRTLSYRMLLDEHLQTFSSALEEQHGAVLKVIAQRLEDDLWVEVYTHSLGLASKIWVQLHQARSPEMVMTLKVFSPENPSVAGLIRVIAGQLAVLMRQYLPHCAGATVQMVGDVSAESSEVARGAIKLTSSLPDGLVKTEVAHGAASGRVALARIGDRPIAASAVLIAHGRPVLLAEDVQPFTQIEQHLTDALGQRQLSILDLLMLDLDVRRGRSVGGGATLHMSINSTQRIGMLSVHFSHRDETVTALMCLHDDQVMVQLVGTTQLMVKELLEQYLPMALRSLGWGAAQVHLVDELVIKLDQTFTDGYDPQNERGLFNADPACHHQVISAPGGGVKCTKCPGWYCA